MAVVYEQFTREDFEGWLDSLRMRWQQKPRTAGVYQVLLSDRVAVEVSSSLTGRDDVVSYAQASMQLRLVSLITGRVINKKAQGQSHFKRTKGWRTSLGSGVDRMVQAYRKAEAFYEALAEIEDQEVYQREMLGKIEAIADWATNDFLTDLHTRLKGGGILTLKQRAAVEDAQEKASRAPQVDEDFLQRLRGLWSAANRAGDAWTKDFAKSIAEQHKRGKSLSPKQEQLLADKMRGFRIASQADAVLFEQFYTEAAK